MIKSGADETQAMRPSGTEDEHRICATFNHTHGALRLENPLDKRAAQPCIGIIPRLVKTDTSRRLNSATSLPP